MKIANQFIVSAPIEQAWDVLCDLEQVIPLMPGAQLTGHEGDDYVGKVKVKVGPITSEFSGKVRFVELDRDQHRAVIDGKGKESRGTGNAAATITAQLQEDGQRTSVTVDTDLKIVGKLAQFSESLEPNSADKNPHPPTRAASPATPESPASAAQTQPEPEPIDLLE